MRMVPSLCEVRRSLRQTRKALARTQIESLQGAELAYFLRQCCEPVTATQIESLPGTEWPDSSGSAESGYLLHSLKIESLQRVIGIP